MRLFSSCATIRATGVRPFNRRERIRHMLLVKPRLLYVSATDDAAPYASITTALQQVAAGDTVMVGPGRYGPSASRERFPLYIPPRVTLAGAGMGESVIEGEGMMALSFRPVSPEQSLVLLGDG